MIPPDYFQNENVLFLGKDLLGKQFVTERGSFLITETESYKAPEDKASHAYKMKRTARNEVMYAQGGCTYVYICYGIHHLLNIVTGKKEQPHAILIRGVLDLEKSTHFVGPGKVAKAMGVTKSANGRLLNEENFCLCEAPLLIDEIEELPRVGIDYAEEYTTVPWRFRLKKSLLEKISNGI